MSTKQIDKLDALEAQSVYILREAYREFKSLVMLWSIGKDSNTLLWLVRKAFLGRVPFPVMLLDTGSGGTLIDRGFARGLRPSER